MYDGGIRVPAVVSWPGRLRAGKVDQAMQVVDWMPTFCALIGFRPEKDLKWDGASMWAFISGERKDRIGRVLYWTQNRNSAVRDGDWKLVLQGGKTELFNLANDPYEKTDLAAKLPDQLAAMKRRLAEVAKADRDSVAKE
jgi:arylsulfatase A-like enzyme